MRSRYEREVVLVVEALDNVGTEEKSGASRRESPTVYLIGIGPQQVAHGAFMRHLLLAVEQPDLVYRVDERAKAAVYAKHSSAVVRART